MKCCENRPNCPRRVSTVRCFYSCAANCRQVGTSTNGGSGTSLCRARRTFEMGWHAAFRPFDSDPFRAGNRRRSHVRLVLARSCATDGPLLCRVRSAAGTAFRSLASECHARSETAGSPPNAESRSAATSTILWKRAPISPSEQGRLSGSPGLSRAQSRIRRQMARRLRPAWRA